LTRIAIHILVKKGELLIWRKNGHFPHCARTLTTLPNILSIWPKLEEAMLVIAMGPSCKINLRPFSRSIVV
jgi:hypothetical protein